MPCQGAIAGGNSKRRLVPSALIFLDNLCVADLGLAWILAEFAQSPPLAEQVPALVKLHADATKLLEILLRRFALAVEPLLLCYEFADPVEERGIGILL